MIETIVFLLYSSCCTLFVALFLLHSSCCTLLVALFLLHSSCCTLLLYSSCCTLLVVLDSLNYLFLRTRSTYNNGRMNIGNVYSYNACIFFFIFEYHDHDESTRTLFVELMCFSRCVIIFNRFRSIWKCGEERKRERWRGTRSNECDGNSKVWNGVEEARRKRKRRIWIGESITTRARGRRGRRKRKTRRTRRRRRKRTKKRPKKRRRKIKRTIPFRTTRRKRRKRTRKMGIKRRRRKKRRRKIKMKAHFLCDLMIF
jgi:hypothetical protein